MRVVRSFIKRSRACCMIYSFSASTADRASSKIKIGVFFKRARAIAIRCRCPPESLIPFSPIIVLYPSGRVVTNSWMLASFAASVISSSLLPDVPFVYSPQLFHEKGMCPDEQQIFLFVTGRGKCFLSYFHQW